MHFWKLIFRIWGVMLSKNYRKAKTAVEAVAADKNLKALGNAEGTVSYCPRCGQRPDRDVRHDEAFERAFGTLAPQRRLGDLHFVIELAVWLRG